MFVSAKARQARSHQNFGTVSKVNNPRAAVRSVATSSATRPQFQRQYHLSSHRSAELKHSSYHQLSTWHSESSRDVLNKMGADHPFPHYKEQTLSDKFAVSTVKFLRVVSDWYFQENLIRRAVMLETVAAVPGMVAGMTHHLRSLRRFEHDNWIKTLLDEAENERMHLWAFMAVSKPTLKDRIVIASVQGLFWNIYFMFYLFAPRTAHRFVGYLEEEACKTYTHFLELIDNGKIKNVPAPDIAKDYWGMPADATLRDMVLVIRADEEDHRDVNHCMSDYLTALKKRTIEFKDINIDHKVMYPKENQQQ